jgi:hypothetical protein
MRYFGNFTRALVSLYRFRQMDKRVKIAAQYAQTPVEQYV